MAQPDPGERRFRVRKDAKIALCVILALMVLVVVIWGRSPGPKRQTPTDKAQGAPTKTEEAAADRASTRSTEVEAARHEAPTDHPRVHSSVSLYDPAATDSQATVRHDPGLARDTSPVAKADDRTPLPTDRTPPIAHKAAPAPTATTHIVEKGDTYMKLAQKYYNDASKWPLIQKANSTLPSTLRIGQKIAIPPVPGSAAKVERPPAPTDATRTDKTAKSSTPTPAPAPKTASTYTVKKGDNFYKIALSVYHDGAKWQKLYQHNRSKLPDPSKPGSLRPGTVLDVPTLASSK
jgi:nucleoid-associated protein YgaU